MGDPIEVLPKWAIDMALKLQDNYEEQSKTPADTSTDGEQTTTEV